MDRLRHILLIATLVATGALAGLSAGASFYGADRAADFFRSAPMAVFWILLAAGTAAGLVAFTRLLKRPGLLGLHAGVLLILCGAMWSSPAGHRLARNYSGRVKPRKGLVRIYQGATTDRLYVPAGPDADQPFSAQMPFALKLHEFRIERYADAPGWDLAAVTWADSGQPPEHVLDLPEQPSGWIELFGTQVRLRVTEYVDRIGEPIPARVVIRLASTGQLLGKLPAEPGATLELSALQARFTVRQVYRNLQIQDGQGTEGDPAGANPAVEIEARFQDGEPVTFWALADRPPGHPGPRALDIEFAPAIEPDDPVQPGAATIELIHPGFDGVQRIILPGDPDAEDNQAPLEAIFPDVEDLSARARRTSLVLARRPRPVKDFLADLEVLAKGRSRLREVIEVNKPLCFGGYHFYQSSYGQDQRGTYTILTAVSDNGWTAVRIGFVLLLGGTFWQLWFAPIARALRRKGARRGD
jgi:hypothetical protein